jgi:hypothetical protein
MGARLLHPVLAVLVALLAAPVPSAAQAWQEYAYPEFGFAVQFPSAPTVERGTYAAGAGVSVPATIYSVREPMRVLSMTVAELANTPAEGRNAIDQAVARLRTTGEIRVDVQAEINDQYGRELSITEKDGSRSIYAIFFINRRLYELKGRILPPNPERRSGDAIRFQQSLRFIRRAQR